MASGDFVRLKKLFFTSDAVLKSVDKKTRRALSHFGGYARRVAKNSIKYGDGTAPPGRPPVAHRSQNFKRRKKSKRGGVVSVTLQASSPLRELIFYAYDSVRKGVVIGPVKFSSKVGAAVAPRALELGGPTRRKLRSGLVIPTRVLPHPYMKPAFDAALSAGVVAAEFRKP